jgi:hypothetical protein
MTFPDIAHYFCWLPTCAHGFEPCERINNNGQMKSRRGTQKTRTSALSVKSVNAALAILTVRLSRIEQTRELSRVLIGVPLADRDLAGGE